MLLVFIRANAETCSQTHRTVYVTELLRGAVVKVPLN